MRELWLPLPWRNDYWISSYGRVKGARGRLLALQKQGCGYLSVQVGKANTKHVHRLVAQTFIPNPEELPQVNHKDGDKHNNHVDNLEWVTASSNKLHALSTGLIGINPNRKLTPDQVQEIRQLLARGTLQKQIASRYGVAPRTVYGIKSGAIYKDVN